MTKLVPPRLRVPLTMVVLGTALSVGLAAARGWDTLAGPEVATMAAAIGYYVWGSRDSDIGTIAGSRPLDERQAMRRLRAQALVGRVAAGSVAVAFEVALAAKATYWPFEVLLLLIVGTFFAAWAYYRDPS